MALIIAHHHCPSGEDDDGGGDGDDIEDEDGGEKDGFIINVNCQYLALAHDLSWLQILMLPLAANMMMIQ